MVWLLIAAAALLALCLTALSFSRARRRREAALADRVRATGLYARLYPVLMQWREMTVEQLAVREDEICARMLRPVRDIHFHYREQGCEPPDGEMRLALAEAVGADLPALTDPARYAFLSHRRRLPSGERSTWYEYLMTNEEKERALQQPSRRSRVPDL